VRSGLIEAGLLSLALASCAIPTPQEASDAVLTLRQYEGWAWAVGIALIWADVALPVPQTAVIAALGIIYGTLLGGLLGTLGLITGGLLGYALILTSARRFAQRFAGSRSLRRMETVFARGGAWAIVLTRSFPYSIPEAVVFLAGLAGMPMRKFIAALTIGSAPTAFVFAAIGAGWADQPILALVLSYALPILLLPVAFYLMRRGHSRTSHANVRRSRLTDDIGPDIMAALTQGVATVASLEQREGGCVCGGVRFKALGDPLRVTICHCTWCRRRTGTAFGTEVVYPQDKVELLGGTIARYRHISDESGRWLDVEFCSRCGSNLGFTLEALPSIRTLPAGTFDDQSWISPERCKFRHVFQRSRRNWSDLSSLVEVYERHFRN
jgi:uncharacterized membrane protein YdjX (TVP38/TMEM64 family)